MEFGRAWRSLIDDFVATPGLVICFLSLFTVHVSNIIGVDFVELLLGDFLSELFLPE